jgi:hypothetical protein
MNSRNFQNQIKTLLYFEKFIKWAMGMSIDWVEFPTLGRRSQFLAQYNLQKNSIKIKNSKNKECEIKKTDLWRIFERYFNAPLEKRHRASYYTDPKWPDTPNRIFAPYIPAVIRHWTEK